MRALLAALVAALLLAGLQTYRLAGEQRDHASTRAAHAEQLAALERAGKEAEQAARAEEQRRAQALQGAIHDAEQELARARADADAAADAGQRLRAQLAVDAGRCRAPAGHPGAAGPGAPTDAAGDLLADVQRRLDEATDTIARHADAARTAGAACERSYQALTSDPAALHR